MHTGAASLSNAKPVAESNSIEAAAFVIQFEREFSELEIEALFALEQRLKDELPSFQKMTALSVNISDEQLAPITRPRLGGVVLQHFQENGKPDWVLRAGHNQITVNCLKYTRWNEISATSIRFLSAAAKSVDSETNRITAVATQFIDKFIYESIPINYDIQDVFRKDSVFLTQQASVSGNQWHVFQGWFTYPENTAFPKGKVLNVINLTSAIQNEQLQAIIDHTSQITFDLPAPVRNIVEPHIKVGSALLGDCYVFLHEQNKIMMRKTLSDVQLKAIKLEQ